MVWLISSLQRKQNKRMPRKKSKTGDRVWLGVVIFLILGFLAGVITLLILSLQYSSHSHTGDIDVVLYQHSDDTRSQRTLPQIHAVLQNMPWINNIFVLTSQDPDPAVAALATYVSFAGNHEDAFEYMPDIPGVAANTIFLDDRTFPFRPTKSSYMYSQDNPRMFNVFREQSEVIFFQQYVELPTLPTLVVDLAKLKEHPQTWRDLVFREVTEERITLKADMNRDVFVLSTMVNNAASQFTQLDDNPPVFATFHVPDTDPNVTAANQQLNTYLSQKFSS